MASLNIHNVISIDKKKIGINKAGGYDRHIEIRTIEGVFDIIVFSDTKTDLEIK